MGSVDFRSSRRSIIFCPSRRRSVLHSCRSRSRSRSRSISMNDPKEDYNQADTFRVITETMGRCLRQQKDLHDVASTLGKGSAVLDEEVLDRLADVVAKSLRLWEVTNPTDRWKERKTTRLWMCCRCGNTLGVDGGDGCYQCKHGKCEECKQYKRKKLGSIAE